MAAVNLVVMIAIDLDHRVVAMVLDMAAGLESDRTGSIGLYAGVEAASGGVIDSTLSMAIDSAQLETVSLDVGAAADSDGVLALAAFASGRTMVLDLGGVAVMDWYVMTDPAVMVVIDSGRLAADD